MGQVSRGLGARAPRAWGPAHQNPWGFFREWKRVFNFNNNPTPPRSADAGLRGLLARSPGPWGPAHWSKGNSCKAPPSQTIPPLIGGPNLSNSIFRGCRVKWLFGGGELEGNEAGTPPTPPPRPHPLHFGPVFTLSAFSNHPTRPPKSADTIALIMGTPKKAPLILGNYQMVLAEIRTVAATAASGAAALGY